MYFTEIEEQALVQYYSTSDHNERSRIFSSQLHIPMKKMAQGILGRYFSNNLHKVNKDDLIADCVAHAIINGHGYTRFKAKAYSYLGTIMRRYYLDIFKTLSRNLDKYCPLPDSDRNDQCYIPNEYNDNIEYLREQLINKLSTVNKLMLTKDELSTLNALTDIINNHRGVSLYYAQLYLIRKTGLSHLTINTHLQLFGLKFTMSGIIKTRSYLKKYYDEKEIKDEYYNPQYIIQPWEEEILCSYDGATIRREREVYFIQEKKNKVDTKGIGRVV